MSKEYLFVDQHGDLHIGINPRGKWTTRPDGSRSSVELIDEWNVTSQGNFIKNPDFEVNTKGLSEYESKELSDLAKYSKPSQSSEIGEMVAVVLLLMAMGVSLFFVFNMLWRSL